MPEKVSVLTEVAARVAASVTESHREAREAKVIPFGTEKVDTKTVLELAKGNAELMKKLLTGEQAERVRAALNREAQK